MRQNEKKWAAGDGASPIDRRGFMLEAGITFFDTADVYGQTNSGTLLGQALEARRQNVVIATKFGADLGDGRKGAKPDYVRQAVEDSLRCLGTDYIDLYQLHMPDPGVPIEDTLGVLHDLLTGAVGDADCGVTHQMPGTSTNTDILALMTSVA